MGIVRGGPRDIWWTCKLHSKLRIATITGGHICNKHRLFRRCGILLLLRIQAVHVTQPTNAVSRMNLKTIRGEIADDHNGRGILCPAFFSLYRPTHFTNGEATRIEAGE